MSRSCWMEDGHVEKLKSVDCRKSKDEAISGWSLKYFR